MWPMSQLSDAWQRFREAWKSTEIPRSHLGQSAEFWGLKRRITAFSMYPFIYPTVIHLTIPTLPGSVLEFWWENEAAHGLWHSRFTLLTQDYSFLSCLPLLTHPSKFSHKSPSLRNNTCNLLFPVPGTPFLPCLPMLSHPAKLRSPVPSLPSQ